MVQGRPLTRGGALTVPASQSLCCGVVRLSNVDDMVKEAVRSAAKDGRLSCKESLELAAGLGVSPGLVGRAADALGVKITGCQLGCFKKEM